MGRKAVNENRERVCLYVDKEVVAYFKHIADIREGPYQPLMNKVLKDWYDDLPGEAKLIRQDR